MASSLPVVIDDDLIQCKLCCRKAVEPKLLPCLHIFCSTCLEKHVSRTPRVTTPPSEEHGTRSGDAERENDTKERIHPEKFPVPADNTVHVLPAVDESGNGKPLSPKVEDIYEIPVRTIDEYGYQIADEVVLPGAADSSEDHNYYNSVLVASSNTYTEMRSGGGSGRKSKRTKESLKKGKEEPKEPIKGPNLRTCSEVSDTYMEPDPEGGVHHRCPSDIYDNIDEPEVTSLEKSRVLSKRMSSSPTSVKRWKVSGVAAPPMMIRRPKGSRSSASVDNQSTASKTLIFPRKTASELIKPNDLLPATLPKKIAVDISLQDIYNDNTQDENTSPIVDLYGSLTKNDFGIYQLEKQVQDCHDGGVGCSVCLETERVDVAKENVYVTLCKSFQCPVCKELVNTPRGWASLDTCSFIAAMQEMAVFYTEDHSCCSNCETKMATYRCFDCKHNLCEGCREAHIWLKVTKAHQVASLSEVRLGRFRTELQEMLSFCCGDHPDQVGQYLCITCRKIICSECLVSKEHPDHWAAPVGDVAAREKNFIESMMESVKRNLDKITSQRKELNEYRLRSEENKNTIMRDIVRQKDKLVSLIESHCATLQEKVEAEYSMDWKRVDDALTVVDSSRHTIQQSVKFVGQLLEHGRPADIVTLSAKVKARLRPMETIRPPSFTKNLTVSFHPTSIAADDIEQMMGLLSTDQDDTKCKMTPVNTDTKPLTVCPKLLLSFPTRTATDDKGCKPTGVAISSSSGDIILVDDINKKVKVFREDGHIRLEFCPTNERRLVDPWDVVMIEGTDQLAVTDRGARDVKIFTTSGAFVNSFGPHLGSPWGIAINSLGNILVTDIVHRKVFVHDRTGSLLSTIPSSLVGNSVVTLRCPEYVSVNVNDDVIVSDFEQHNVTIFDKFGRFIAKYGDRNDPIRKLKVPCGVTVDLDGDIYVADYNNRRIVRLSRNGSFRCHYATNDSQLVMPQTLAFNRDGNLVVVDRTHVKIFAISEGTGKPKPKPRKKSEEARRKTISAKPVKVHQQSVQLRGTSSFPFENSNRTNVKENSDSNPVAKIYLETEVW